MIVILYSEQVIDFPSRSFPPATFKLFINRKPQFVLFLIFSYQHLTLRNVKMFILRGLVQATRPPWGDELSFFKIPKIRNLRRIHKKNFTRLWREKAENAMLKERKKILTRKGKQKLKDRVGEGKINEIHNWNTTKIREPNRTDWIRLQFSFLNHFQWQQFPHSARFSRFIARLLVLRVAVVSASLWLIILALKRSEMSKSLNFHVLSLFYVSISDNVVSFFNTCWSHSYRSIIKQSSACRWWHLKRVNQSIID